MTALDAPPALGPAPLCPAADHALHHQKQALQASRVLNEFGYCERSHVLLTHVQRVRAALHRWRRTRTHVVCGEVRAAVTELRDLVGRQAFVL